MLSSQRRREIVDALRRGTVPSRSLDTFAVGLERFAPAIEDELDQVSRGSAVFKAVRGDYGSGKTFFARWIQETAKRRGFVTSEVQISDTETPLHRLETVYRRLIERLGTTDQLQGAFRSIIDGWFFTLEQDVLAEGTIAETDTGKLVRRANELMEKRLGSITRTAPAFASVLRGYRECLEARDTVTAESLIAWLAGQPNVAAAAKRIAGVKGEIDHFGAFSFLQGLLVVLRDSGQSGLLLVLDEVETIQRQRTDVRDRGLNALRQIIDEVDSGRFPGLYVMVTGTPAFFDGTLGVQRSQPLAQRLHVDFSTDSRFDNPRAVQIRLGGFDIERLGLVGRKIRDIYADGSNSSERIRGVVDDAYIDKLAIAVTGALGGKVGIAPRLFLKKLVADVLDRVDQFADFDPRRDYALTMAESELTDEERGAREPKSADDIPLDLT